MADTPSTERAAGAGKAVSLTPAMRQYLEQKTAVPDALLLFRMGDFYEMFFEDAVTASKALGITLTSRGKDNAGGSIPLAGIPYHALDSYLPKLVRAGFKVAISEQVEDPKTAKGVVKRAVVRIVTPGTLTEDNLLERQCDNYLACLCRRRDEVGLAFVELSTGAFCVQVLKERQVLDELVRLAPAELLLPEVRIDTADPLQHVAAQLTGPGALIPNLATTRRPAHLFDNYQAEQVLKKHFQVATLAGFGFDKMDPALCAAAAIVDYLAETQKTALHHIVKLTRRDVDAFVRIDQATWRSLEVERTIRGNSTAGSLVQAVDRTRSAMGARCLRRWLVNPLRDPAAITARQDAIADLLCDRHLLGLIRNELGKLADIERIVSRLGVGRVTPRDLVALGNTLSAIEQVAVLLSDLPRSLVRDTFGQQVESESSTRSMAAYLTDRQAALSGQKDLAEYLNTSLSPDAPLAMNEGGIIAAGFDAELDRLRGLGADGQQWLADYQNRESQRTGIPSLKVGFNSVFGYYIEITHAHAAKVPADYVRKQTIKNAERYITDELKKFEAEVLSAQERAINRELQLFDIIRQHCIERIAALQQLAWAVAEIDCVAGLAYLADERRYVRPELCEEPVLDIGDGRHPVLEQMLAEKFVPNDCLLGNSCGSLSDEERLGGSLALPGLLEMEAGGNTSGSESGEAAPRGLKPAARSRQQRETLAILTGPNMAGKSTYIRQVALLVLLAQTGSYVPATRMRFAPADRIFARVGASDEITRGHSTFMVEMTEAANILNNATAHSLVILDELGRGTSTFDGLSLAWAIAEQLVTQLKCRCLFATHYHELTELEHYLSGVVNYNVAVREWEEQIIFLHRIVRGGTDKSYGAHVAKLAGIPGKVIRRSKELLAELEANFASVRRAPVRSAIRTREPENQMMLFTDPGDEVLNEIRTLDPDTLTPLEALQRIEQWRKRLR